MKLCTRCLRFGLHTTVDDQFKQCSMCRELARKYYNSEKGRATQKRWVVNNREKRNAINRAHWRRKREAGQDRPQSD